MDFLKSLGLTEAWLQAYGVWVAAAIVTLLLVVWLVVRLRRRAKNRGVVIGMGHALALALDRDWAAAEDCARRTLSCARSSQNELDALLGLLAILRMRGDFGASIELLRTFEHRLQPAMFSALQVRIALDAGNLERALELVSKTEVHVELEIAVLCRTGRFGEALDRYFERVPRRQRSPKTEATLRALYALALSRGGEQEKAQKEIARALGEGGDVVSAAGALLHAKAAEREQLAKSFETHFPGLLSDVLPLQPAEKSEVLKKALQLNEAGSREEALAVLREHLNAAPCDWAVRRQYDLWLCENSQSEELHSELSELIPLFPKNKPATVACSCSSCGFTSAHLFFICPRCDALGQIAPAPLTSPSEVSEAGTDLRDVLRGLPSQTCAGIDENVSI